MNKTFKAYSQRTNVNIFFDGYHLSNWIKKSIEIAEKFTFAVVECEETLIATLWSVLNRIKRRLNQQDDVSLYIKS